jgi:hypothetical protein
MAISISILKYSGPPADGGHPGGRRTGGHPGGRRTGGRYTADGHTYMLTLWGKGGYGGSPNVEAGEMYQHQETNALRLLCRTPGKEYSSIWHFLSGPRFFLISGARMPALAGLI